MNILIIPSAIVVNNEIQKRFGRVPPALVPLPEGNMLENILRFYDGLVDKVYIISAQAHEKIEEFIKLKNLEVDEIVLDTIKTLGYTIQQGMKIALKENKKIERVYINFADTLLYNKSLIPKKNSGINDFIFFDNTNDLLKWTTFQINDASQITYISDKCSGYIGNKECTKKENSFFIGSFCFSNAKLLYHLLTNSTNEKGVDNFYIALKEYTNAQEVSFFKNTCWYDVGHSDLYVKARTGVAARAFNEIKIDSERGILRKTSNNRKKLIDEIKWYLRLPNKLQYLAPRIYDYSLEFNNPFVDMEFYGYHTLHESYISGDLPIETWKNIFKRIKFIINEMSCYSVTSSHITAYETLHTIYFKKVVNRLRSLSEQEGFKIKYDMPIIINEKKYKPLDEYLQILDELVNECLIKTFSNTFNIIHGDLCFSNILVEENYNFMRVIDPRGSFGDYDIYGDSRYELAKLLHSVEGGYDFIIEDLFQLEVDSTNVIHFRLAKQNTAIESEFKRYFFGNNLDLLNAVRLIESTLFLSMIPLHSDHIKRQYAMFATGIKLLDQVIHYRAENTAEKAINR